MKRLMFSLLAIGMCFSSYADGTPAQITSTPSPAVSNQPLEIRITTSDMGSDVYCYTWCKEINGQEQTPSWGWDDVYTSKFKMTGSGGSYSLSINNIAEYYGLSDSDLAGLTKLGFIAKTRSGNQTADVIVDVVQGRRQAYSGGEGTQASPFILSTADDLRTLISTSSDWASGTYFRMEADIDAMGIANGIGSVSSPFRGVFDGNGHSIKNLVLTSTAMGNATGLFNSINGATIRNLGVVNAMVSGTTFTGILCGYMQSGTIERCFTAGVAKGSSICVGGLVGESVGGEIRNCYSGARVNNTGDYVAGGLVGKNTGTISNSYTAGAVNGYDYVGGISGANYGRISNSVALNASVTASHNFAARFGGNNNESNTSEGNHSWDAITPGHGSWSSHGDHATTKEGNILRNFDLFKELTGWDFDSVWEWRVEGTKEYPVLRSLANQDCYLSDAYFDGNTSSEFTVSEASGSDFIIGPNPTDGEIRIRSIRGIGSYSIFNLNATAIESGDAHGENAISIDLGTAPAGIYILSVSDMEGTRIVKKIIKK